MYKIPDYHKSKIGSVPKMEGETIELKIERIMQNKEPIKDGAPIIFTERKDGVIAAYNPRTDRFEIAAEAMDTVQKTKLAERENRAKAKENKEIKIIDLDNGVEPIHGKDKQGGN